MSERIPRGTWVAPGDTRSDTHRAETSSREAPQLELMDLGATLVELAGARQVPRTLARSVVPVLENPSLPHRQVAVAELRRSGEVMMATAEWKMALNGEGQVYLLYDLRADPSEKRNVAGLPDYEQIERDLRRRMDETLEATR